MDHAYDHIEKFEFILICVSKMVRKLQFHEQKLLRKVNFIQWEPNNVNEIRMMKKYGVDRSEYAKWVYPTTKQCLS